MLAATGQPASFERSATTSKIIHQKYYAGLVMGNVLLHLTLLFMNAVRVTANNLFKVFSPLLRDMMNLKD